QGADFDRDGHGDFVGAAPGHLYVFMADVNGGPQAPIDIPFGGTATALLIQTGDVNGDGFPDAVVLMDDGTLWTFLNANSPAVFLPPTSMPLPNAPMIRL